MSRPIEDPFLRGMWEPWPMEGDAWDLCVSQGELPAGLTGTLFRNGPNQQFAPRAPYHPFDGDGMIHAFRFEDGKVHYKNRWVRTARFELERRHGESLFGGMTSMAATDPRAASTSPNSANTNIYFHAGKLLALWEAGAPTEIDPLTLETRGIYTFDDKLVQDMPPAVAKLLGHDPDEPVPGIMTAHPKTCPTTGEMLFFGYSPMPPFITYHVVDADGKLVRSEPINAPYPSMIHDFLVSENHVIFPVFPAVFDLAAMGQGKPGITWKPELGVHIGVMPRDGSDGDVTWIPMDPVHAFHFMNAYEDGDEIVADASCYAQLPLFEGDFDVDAPALPPDFRRWRFDVAARSVKEETIDDGVMEFPRIDERWNGRRHRHGFTAGAVAERLNQGYDRLHHYDLETGSCQAHVLPDGDKTSEAVFVPRGDGADEGEGYVLALAYRGAEHRSDLLVLDARNLDAEPVASVKLPHRIPGGFHGNWMPGGDAWRP